MRSMCQRVGSRRSAVRSLVRSSRLDCDLRLIPEAFRSRCRRRRLGRRAHGPARHDRLCLGRDYVRPSVTGREVARRPDDGPLREFCSRSGFELAGTRRLTSRALQAPHPYVWMSSARSNSVGLGLETEGRELPLSELPAWTEDKVKVLPAVRLSSSLLSGVHDANCRPSTPTALEEPRHRRPPPPDPPLSRRSS